MTTIEALEIGIFALGPILLLAGIFFALAITASQHHHMLGKALGWPASVIAGLVWGAHLGSVYLPDWQEWSVVWFFGVGWFAIWMLVGIFSHSDLTYHYWPLITRFFKWLSSKIKALTGKTAPSGRVYSARAASRDEKPS